MKTFIALAALLLISATLRAQSGSAPAVGELTQLLHDFMAGASVNDAEMHDRFWAEDLIYTSSSGERFGKAAIMEGLQNSESQQPEAPETVYTAEEIKIQQYGKVAVVAFKLVGKTKTADGTERQEYLNSGTFVKRNDLWKVVNWQATKVPEPQ